MALKEDYKDAIFAGLRKYKILDNGDGTVSPVDMTEYEAAGDKFGAKDVNAITKTVNATGEIIADDNDGFKPDQKYVIEDIVIYDNKTWRFKVDHEPGEWDESQVERTNILAVIAEQNKNFAELAENLTDKDNPILLLDTAEVTTSFKDFILAQSYKNFKKLYFEVEMNYFSNSDINFFCSEVYVATLQPNRTYCIYRQVPAGSSEYNASCYYEILENDPTKLSIRKMANGYNGCRRINIFGIK